MRYELITDKNKLIGTEYVEFCPELNPKNFRNENSLFLSGDFFNFIEDILESKFINYKAFNITILTNEEIRKLISHLNERREFLIKNKSLNPLLKRYNYKFVNREYLSNQNLIENLMAELIFWLEDFASDNLPISILGL